MNGPATLALDIGGTKLAAALVSDDGAVTRRHQVPVGGAPAGEADQLWASVLALLDDVLDGREPTAVGIGCGGPLRLDLGEVSTLNIHAWRGFPLVARMQSRFPGAQVRLHNDAVTMALGEHWRGAGQGTQSFMGVVLSTGVGGGVVLDGHSVDGPTGNAGHLGHVVVEPDGPPCPCGGFGCLEAVASGPSAVRLAIGAGWVPDGPAPDGRDLVAAAQAGDPVAAAAVERAGRALGVGLASAANLFELERVAVGGGFALGAGELILEPAREGLARHAGMDFAAACEIIPAVLGNDAGLVGAAALVLDHLG